MKILIDELRKAFDNKLYYLALNTALLIPDICSSMADKNGKTTGEQYKKWFDQYCSDKFSNTLTGDDVWKLRCALLHQGKINHDYPKYQKIIFHLPDLENENSAHNNVINNDLVLDLGKFISVLHEGFTVWLDDIKDDATFKSNITHSVKYREGAVSPIIPNLHFKIIY